MKTIARAPFIEEITLVTNGVEQSFVLQSDPTLPSIKRIQVKSRTLNDLKYRYISSGPFVTIFAGQTYWQDEIDAWLLTIFLVGTIDGQIAELEYWL